MKMKMKMKITMKMKIAIEMEIIKGKKGKSLHAVNDGKSLST